MTDESLRNSPLSSAIFWLGLLVIYLFSWHLQTELVLNSDVSWLLLAAKRLWAGGSYGKDFFELNPPLIFYVYGLPVAFMKILHVSTAIALRLSVFAVGTISLTLCYFLQGKIFLVADEKIRCIFFFMLPLVFFIMPINEFGQREHFLILLSVPYFFLTACRLQDKPVARITANLIGVMAGLGFAIKPYFLLGPVFVEFYYLTRMKNLGSTIRSENAGILIVLFSYLVILIWRHEDYLHTVVPLLTHYYYQSVSLPYSVMLGSEQAYFTYFACAFYLLEYRTNAYKFLSTVLLAGALGFLFSFSVQKTLWYYHELPVMTFSLLLFILLFAQLVTRKSFSREEYISTGLYALALFSYLAWRVDVITLSILNYPAAYFALFAVVFGILFYAYPAKKNLASLRWISILGVTFLFYQSALYTVVHHSIFLLTTLLALLVFSLCVPIHRIRFTYFALLGMLIFALPFHQTGFIYLSASGYKKLYVNLQNLLSQYPKQSIYILTSASEFSFPALENTKHPFVSRFGCLFGWLPPAPATATSGYYQKVYQDKKSFYDFYFQALADDLNKSKPDLIFVDTRNGETSGRRRYFGGYQIDYYDFFSQSQTFNKLLQQYIYVKTADGQPFYRFRIYRRV